MEILVLVFAVLILMAGVALWRTDAAKSGRPARPATAASEAAVDEDSSYEEEPSSVAEEAAPQQVQAWDQTAPQQVVRVEDTPAPPQRAVKPDRAADIYEDDFEELDTAAEAELAAVPEVSAAQFEQPAEAPAPAPIPEVAEEPLDTVEPPAAADGELRGVEKHSFLNSLPGSQRRERKHWAARHNFDFIKEDAFLTDEWSRGAASTGAVARDVVSGMAAGYETHLVDLAGIPVMAMRRGTNSDIVIDARRGEYTPDVEREESEDLVEIATVSEFRLLSNGAGVAQRFVDERVLAAFEAMPEAVTAVWMESEWVLAETIKGSTAEDWEEILHPLALLTDASFTLPPRSTDKVEVDLKLIEPTRLKPQAPQKPAQTVEPEEIDLAQPLVIRPEEPLQMPVRGHQESRGVVEPRSLGADAVESIADGRPEAPSDLYGTRVVRDLNGKSSIFEDAPESNEPPQPWQS
ncbi:hypothetical protein SFC07_09255 [Corynebacterium callunae]|uniref:hypothetical protein n=1 Tax=Corynebacterium callunae TaxID=1721 RepID=UPI00398201BF